MKHEVLFLSHKYPPATGGMEKFSFELIHGFENLKGKVHKIVFEGNESRLSWFLQFRKRVRAVLDAHPEIGIVHANDALMAYLCRWIRKEYDVKIAVTFHGLDIVFPLGVYQKEILPSYNNYFDLFICVSRATADAAIVRGISSSKITVIRNGVDHDLSSFSPDEAHFLNLLQSMGFNDKPKKLIVGLGRGVKRKGYGWFVKNVLPSLDTDICFIMLGARTPYEQYEKYLSILLPATWKTNLELLLGLSTDDGILAEYLNDEKLKGRYYRPGYLKFNDICQILLHSDLFIMPNLKEKNDMEGFGLVALEASILGKHVLVSSIDGITDAIVNGRNGEWIESGNPQIWISTINHLMKDKENLKQLGLSGKSYTLQHYSWSSMVNEYSLKFDDLIR